MSYVALQDKEKIDKWLARCGAILPKVKSDTQRAWQLTFMYIATGNIELHCQASTIVGTWTVAPNDRKRHLILATLDNFETFVKRAMGH